MTTRARAAALGVGAVAVALGVGELIAGLVRPVPSLVLAIGDGVVDLGAGTPVKTIAVALFGTSEKTALVIGTVVLALVIGAGLGVLARRRTALAVAGIAAFGALGVVATVASPLADARWAAVAAVPAVVAGSLVLRTLVGAERSLVARTGEQADRGRRDVLRLAGAAVAVGALLGWVGRALAGRQEVAAARADVDLPAVAAAAVPVPARTAFDAIAGLSPLFTPVEDFYRIDTALMAPSVDVASWRLRIDGLVAEPLELSYDDLLAMPQVEADITIACVSNEVGGDLIGTARWQGVRLADLLDRAGVDPAAGQVVGHAVDGWTAGFPVEVALDGREALVAVAMGGEPLPVEHGFPARLVVPGLYGYVSATKWLSRLELATWEGVDGYWIPRGWAKEGPIKTQSRIDVPRQRDAVAAGRVVVAGVAWAPHTGIEAVEVSVDGGPWQAAELADELGVDVWRQWRFTWAATAGQHELRVRATDRSGFTQREQRVPVAPDGAEGYHTRVVRVT
jgi:DMSO/TMAO reductase YedYZ molybdopterin-dependent catalytic subunit